MPKVVQKHRFFHPWDFSFCFWPVRTLDGTADFQTESPWALLLVSTPYSGWPSSESWHLLVPDHPSKPVSCLISNVLWAFKPALSDHSPTRPVARSLQKSFCASKTSCLTWLFPACLKDLSAAPSHNQAHVLSERPFSALSSSLLLFFQPYDR